MQLSLIAPSPDRAPLRYFGGKFSMAAWIIQAIDRHLSGHQLYCEPFGGSYGVGFQKLGVETEVYNEVNPLVVNFFVQLKANPGALIRAIESTDWEADYALTRQLHIDPIEQARRTYIEAELSWVGAGGRWDSGFKPALVSRNHASGLWEAAARLEHTIIQQGDAIACIRQWDRPDALFYIDPTYLWKARKSKDSRHKAGAPRRQYAHEMSEAQHIELGKLLRSIQGGAIVSGYDSPLYDSLFDGWEKLSRKTRGSHGETLECLWINRSGVAG